jgi:DNA-binding SARP family transcriptional activator
MPAAPKSSSLTVFALGPLRILRDSKPISPAAWVRLKSRTLFAYLLCIRPRGVHKEVLIDLLWPTADPERGAHALHVALSDLRVTLGSRRSAAGGRHIRRTGDLYTLDVGDAGWVDAETFAVACESARQADAKGDRNAAMRHLQAAEALYDGDFLVEEPYAEWAAARRDRLRDDYVDLLIRLLRQYESAADAESAVRYARKALGVDPYLEPCYRHLMRNLQALGDRIGVLRTYARCQQAMREGFDSDISPETRALAESFLGSGVDSVVKRHRLRELDARGTERTDIRLRTGTRVGDGS